MMPGTLTFPLDLSMYNTKAVSSQPKFLSSFPEVPQPELMLTTTRGRATVAGLDSRQEYALQVLVLNGTTEKLLAKRRFTSKKCSKVGWEDSKRLTEKKEENRVSPRKQFQCDSSAAADIMLLVDGSWSIGRTNFRRVRDFLEGLVTPFHIGPNHIQIGLTQYSGDPRTEWHLNNFTTKDQLLEAVRNFRYKGGNTFTGQALLHVMEENMRPEVGARSEAQFFLVLLTDGKSQDDAISAASRLKNAGVEIIAVGVKNADEAELRQVASEPVDLNVYNVNDFPLLSKLVARLVHILCGRIEDRSIAKHPVLSYPSPTDLRFSDLGSREVKLHWTNPAKPVQQYRVVYHSAEGQSPQEVRNVSCKTSSDVSLFSSSFLFSSWPSHSVPLAMPANLEVTPSSFSMLRVNWGAAPGATQYMILYSALNHGEPDDAKEEKFSADQTMVELTGLLSATDYSVTLYALYDEEPSDPVTAVATTCKTPFYYSIFLFVWNSYRCHAIFFSFLLILSVFNISSTETKAFPSMQWLIISVPSFLPSPFISLSTPLQFLSHHQ
uniref:Collagen, type XIV, alpha 1b n=1 Tax=Monopterus albus TaxID=43700 RepID=A0A3Q3IV05_MONAL